ncbi:MAG: hypothetical protein KA902_00480 [Arenimonas sp.]|nr:hypothetical protein [Arenimonas sp.]
MNISGCHLLHKRVAFTALILTSLLLSACSSEPENPADAIYFGGDILTMVGEQPQYVEAIAVDEGKISFIGSKLEADKLVGKATTQFDLKGATLIPRIVTGIQQTLTSQGITSAPNCWKATTFKTNADLIAALKVAQLERAKIGLGLFCMGYVPNATAALTTQELDVAFPETSVILVDASLQNLLTNSLAKKKFSLDGYKSLRNAISISDQPRAGLAVGQSADFMIIDKNPLKDKTLSLASINITQTFVQGAPITDAPKDLAMLAILDVFTAYAEEKVASAKLDEMHKAAEAKLAANAAEAKKLADKKAAESKLAKNKSQQDAKSKPQADVKKTTNAKPSSKPATPKPAEATLPEVTTPAKAPVARFNMTQDGKKMTAADFDAWMKAQGIRIVPAKAPVEAAPTPPVKTDGDK